MRYAIVSFVLTLLLSCSHGSLTPSKSPSVQRLKNDFEKRVRLVVKKDQENKLLDFDIATTQSTDNRARIDYSLKYEEYSTPAHREKLATFTFRGQSHFARRGNLWYQTALLPIDYQIHFYKGLTIRPRKKAE